MSFKLRPLPLPAGITLETPAVLRQLAKANRQLAELKGAAATIPNENILIDTLALQEAKDSSEIENIITTADALYRDDAASGVHGSVESKEVHHYAQALRAGFERVRKSGVIRLDDILAVQEILEPNKPGLRKVPGTVLKNKATGELIYEPPQGAVEVAKLMDNFVTHLNRSEPGDDDPLVRMAVLHYQFESIHPFYDGNGRTGRILNLLHLVLHGLLDLPVLYLSRYIVRSKADYYAGLQAVRDRAAWEEWVLYVLNGVEDTARDTLARVAGIRDLMQGAKQKLRGELPKIYSQDLLNNLFRHPYTKIEFIERDLGVSRPTAIKYLDALVRIGLVRKTKLGRTNYYINAPLFALLSR
ncbi:MAG TPA: Fic family protein [Verrucomicrobiae bacterium]|nr:Fic family protein [Verrucomicrobiae bacterium]